MLTSRMALCSLVFSSLVFVSLAASGAELAHDYEYDELGRLKKTVSPDIDVTYTLDPAGNRTLVSSAAGKGWPASISVPLDSETGDYTIAWSASTGTGSRYELYEADNASFAGEVPIYNAGGLSHGVTAKPDGSYYYRVRACDATSCGPNRQGGNSIRVARPIPPAAPAGIAIPTGDDIDGAYTILWAEPPSGTVTAYQLYEATNSSFSGQVKRYEGIERQAALSGKDNGEYFYRVAACNKSACSPYRTGAWSVVVTLPPGVPGIANVPAYSNGASYSVTWSASTGVLTRYELLESVAFGSEALIYSGPNQSLAIGSRADGVYAYRLRACNRTACSGYNATVGNGGVIFVDRVPPAPPATLTRRGDGFLDWGGGSTDSSGSTSGTGSGVGSWKVYRNGGHVGTSEQPRANWYDPSPPANQPLSYTVRSVDRAGNESTTSSPAYAYYLDTIAPTTPGSLRVTGTTTGSVSLAWNASSDSNGISYYNVERTPGPRSATEFGLTHTDGTVSSNVTYTYSVTAVDNNGVRSTPATITATTPSGAPTNPVLLGAAFVRDTDGRFAISWNDTAAAYYLLKEGSGGEYRINAPALSKSFVYGNGTYIYQVRGCTAGGVCSGYSAEKMVEVCISSCN